MTTEAVPTDVAHGAPSRSWGGAKEARRRERTAAEKKAVRRRLTDRLVISTLVLAALVFALAPIAGTFWSNYQMYKISQEEAAANANKPASVQAAQLAAAREYNAKLDPDVMFVPIGAKPESNPAYQAYAKQLNTTDSMAVVRIPEIKVSLPVRHGTSDAVLAKGAGHIYGTSLPVGGIDTHASVSAHSALAQMTGFDRLGDMKKGDLFFFDVMGETLAYKVTQIDVVTPDKLDMLKVVKGKDLATLVTCTPYGINSHRLLVTGERVPYDAKADKTGLKDSFDWTIQDWMWQRIVVAGISALILLACAVKWVRDDVRRRRMAKGLPVKGDKKVTKQMALD